MKSSRLKRDWPGFRRLLFCFIHQLFKRWCAFGLEGVSGRKV